MQKRKGMLVRSGIIIALLLMTLLVGCTAQLPLQGEGIDEDELDLLGLSQEESDVYDRFKSTHNEEELRGLEPISVMKLYIHSGVEKDYETEWELYTKNDNQLGWDKDYHMSIPDSDRKTDYSVFKNALNMRCEEGVQYTVISWEGKYWGEYDGEGNPFRYSFSLVKSEDGIWKVCFLPMQ